MHQRASGVQCCRAPLLVGGVGTNGESLSVCKCNNDTTAATKTTCTADLAALDAAVSFKEAHE